MLLLLFFSHQLQVSSTCIAHSFFFWPKSSFSAYLAKAGGPQSGMETGCLAWCPQVETIIVLCEEIRHTATLYSFCWPFSQIRGELFGPDTYWKKIEHILYVPDALPCEKKPTINTRTRNTSSIFSASPKRGQWSAMTSNVVVRLLYLINCFLVLDVM